MEEKVKRERIDGGECLIYEIESLSILMSKDPNY